MEYIYAVPLPAKVKGVIVERLDDVVIFVNDNLNEYEQKEAAQHELNHFRMSHVWSDQSVGALEK